MVRYIGGEAIEVIDAETSVNDTSGGRSSLSSSSCKFFGGRWVTLRRKLNQDWMTSYITQFLNVRTVAPAGRVPKITSYGENL